MPEIDGLMVIAVDWSAADGPGPARPAKDRCWLAHGTDSCRPPAKYFRTRTECIDAVIGLCEFHHGPVLLAVDFPLGYPALKQTDGTPTHALPSGRELARLLSIDGGMLIETADARTNRFEVAAELNRRVAEVSDGCKPFWGVTSACDPTLGIPAKKPEQCTPTLIDEFRAVEALLRSTRAGRPQSAWKLAYTGSVGSQLITGMAHLDRVASTFPDRVRFWPFETGFEPFWASSPHVIVIGEMYPALSMSSAGPEHRASPIRDQSEVICARDTLLETTVNGTLGSLPTDRVRTMAMIEGWILGVDLPPSLIPESG